MKKKKKFGVETVLGYCPNNIAKKKFLYCKVPIVLQRKGLEGMAG